MTQSALSAAKSTSWGRKVLFIAGAALVSLLLLEAGLRLLAFAIGEGRIGAAGADQQGRRQAYTIVCVGDSWTRGQPSGSYPEFLEQKLNRRADGRRYRVVNLGASGTNSTQCVLRLAEALPAYGPRLVIVLTGNNDHWNLAESAYWKFVEPDKRPGLLAAKTRVAMHSLRVFRLARLAYCLLTGQPTPNRFLYFQPGELAPTDPPGVVDPEAHRAQLTYNLYKIIELTELDNVQLIFLTYFHFHGFRVNEIIADVAAAQGIPLVNNTILFHTEIPPENRGPYLIEDGHPSPVGYEFMARKILEVIQEHGLLDR